MLTDEIKNFIKDANPAFVYVSDVAQDEKIYLPTPNGEYFVNSKKDWLMCKEIYISPEKPPLLWVIHMDGRKEFVQFLLTPIEDQGL